MLDASHRLSIEKPAVSAAAIEAALLHLQRLDEGAPMGYWGAQVTAPLQPVASTTIPNTMRYHAKPTKVCVLM